MENRVKFEITTITILKIALAVFLIWLLWALREIIVLFFIVLVIVSALDPIVDRLSRFMPRFLAVLILLLIFLGLITAIGFIVIPPIVEQLQLLATNLPYFINKFLPFYQNLKNAVPNYQDSLFNFSSRLGGVTTGIFSTTLSFISGLVYIVTILVLSFYMLLAQNSLKNFLEQVVTPEYREKVFDVVRKISLKMGSWLRGQALLMLLVGALDAIALYSLGVPYALTLAVWGGLTEIIPYIGPWLGLLPAVLIAFTVSPIKALFVLIAFLLIQQIEGHFIVPKVMSRAVGLSPVIIILSLLAGAKILGILGMFIAVPLAAAFSVLIQEWPEFKKIYNNN